MGGNAIPNARRIDKAEYDVICDEIEEKLLDGDIYESDFYVVKAYRNKPDFGDIDIVINQDAVIDQQELIDLFNPEHYFINSNVVSLSYKGIQVDFIITPDHHMMDSVRYFAYNDLGNLMGRIVHKFGFKYGHKGLSYCVREGDHLIKEIFIQIKPSELFKLFDFNHRKYESGFDELEDIFQFVADSKYFSKDIYQFDNMNHRSRVRDAKRKTYNSFLNWIEEQPLKQSAEYDKKSFLRHMLRNYPAFKFEYNQVLTNLALSKVLKDVFNGHLVSTWTFLQGKELGAFMTEFRKEYSDGEILHFTGFELYENVNNFLLEFNASRV